MSAFIKELIMSEGSQSVIVVLCTEQTVSLSSLSDHNMCASVLLMESSRFALE